MSTIYLKAMIINAADLSVLLLLSSLGARPFQTRLSMSLIMKSLVELTGIKMEIQLRKFLRGITPIHLKILESSKLDLLC